MPDGLFRAGMALIMTVIWLFFGSFIVTAVFVVFNLFIAVVLNSMESVKAEHQAEEDARNPGLSLLRRVDELRDGLDQFERALRTSR